MAVSQKEYEMAINLSAKYTGNSAMQKAENDLKMLSKMIVENNKTLMQVEAYQKASAKLQELASKGKEGSAEFQRLTKQTESLEKQLVNAGVNTSELSSEEDLLVKRSEGLRQKQEDVADALGEMREEADRAGDSLVGMIDIEIFERASGYMQKFTDAVKACVKESMEFEATMSKVEALSGETGSSLGQLSDLAKELGATTVYTASEAAEGLSMLSLAGYTAQEQIDTLPAVLNLASSSAMDLGTASSAVADNIHAFGLETQDAAKLVDIMAYAMSSSNTSTEELSEAYKTVAATSSSLGVSVEDTTAILMSMANSGLRSTEAGNGLNAIMTRLATNTSNCADELAHYGVQVYDSEGNMNDMLDILRSTAGVFDSLSESEQANLAKTIAGQRQYTKLRVILNGFSESAYASGRSIDDFAAQLETCGGTAQRMADTMLDNLQGRLTILESAFSALKTSIGESVTPALNVMVEGLTGLTNMVNMGAREFPGFTSAIASAGTAFAAATTAITAFGAAVKVADMALKALKLGMGTAELLTWVGIASAAIGVIVGVGTAIYNAAHEADQFNKAALGMGEALQDSVVQMSEASSSAEASADVINFYCDQLDALGTVTEDDKDKQRELHFILSEMVNTVPELAGLIDLQTDSIEGGTAAIREQTEAWKKNAQMQAAQDYLNAAYAEQSAVLLETAENTVKLNKAKDDQAKIDKEIADLTEQYNSLRATEIAKGFEIREKLELLNEKKREAYDTEKLLTEALGKDAEAQELAKEKIDEATAVTEEYEKALGGAENATKGLTGASQGLVDEEGNVIDMSSQLSAQEQQLINDIDATMQEIDELAQEYNDLYEAAYKSLQGQFQIWEEAKGLCDEQGNAISYTTAEIQKNLESQLKYWTDYETNLATLEKASATIPGLGDMIASFADGSAESVATISALAETAANGTPGQLQTVVDAWQKVDDKESGSADHIANMGTNMKKSADDAVKGIKSSLEGLDCSEAARSAAAKTMSAYSETISTYSGTITSQVAQLAADVAAQMSSISASASTPPTGGSGKKGKSGFAVGTEDAERGFHMVGENGPELMFFNGGEKVLNARKTKELIRESKPSAPVQAGSTVQVTVAPVYNLTGSAPAEDIKAILAKGTREVEQAVRRAVDSYMKDKERRAFA